MTHPVPGPCPALPGGLYQRQARRTVPAIVQPQDPGRDGHWLQEAPMTDKESFDASKLL
jgi:hypothetical protein